MAIEIDAQVDARQQNVVFALEAETNVWQVCKVDYDKRIRLLEYDKETSQNMQRALETEKLSWQKCKADYDKRIRLLESDKEALETELAPHRQRVADEAYKKAKVEEEAKAKAEEDEARRQNALWVTSLKSSEWVAEFYTHIACTLEESGYPRRLNSPWKALPAPARKLGAPSSAVLSALQKKARDRILSYTASTLKEKSNSDLLMRAQFLCPATNQKIRYSLVIRLDDAKFPANAAYVRAAARSGNLGDLVHRFVPRGNSAAKKLYVTLYDS